MKKLYVGNLSFHATEEDVRAEFENLGIQVESVKFMRERDTDRFRGFGFVEIANDGDLAKAVENLNGKEVEGRPIVVNEAKPQTFSGGERGGRPGSSERGGGGRGGRGGHGGGGRRGW